MVVVRGKVECLCVQKFGLGGIFPFTFVLYL